MTQYNYTTFDMDRELRVFNAFRERMFVGEKIVSFDLENLVSGETVSMKTLWSSGPAVIEFGSFT